MKATIIAVVVLLAMGFTPLILSWSESPSDVDTKFSPAQQQEMQENTDRTEFLLKNKN